MYRRDLFLQTHPTPLGLIVCPPLERHLGLILALRSIPSEHTTAALPCCSVVVRSVDHPRHPRLARALLGRVAGHVVRDVAVLGAAPHWPAVVPLVDRYVDVDCGTEFGLIDACWDSGRQREVRQDLRRALRSAVMPASGPREEGGPGLVGEAGVAERALANLLRLARLEARGDDRVIITNISITNIL